MRVSRLFALGGLVCLLAIFASGASADVYVGNVFLNGYDGWQDTYAGTVTPPANWGVLLVGEQALMEASNTILGTSGMPIGTCDVFKMVNLDYSTPANYTLTAKVASWDDDGFGLIFGYQDENNYFRVSCRAQNADSFGFPRGVSVQKVVGGTITQLAQNTTIRPSIPCLATTNAGVFYDLAVEVSGNTYTVKGNFNATGVVGEAMTTYLGPTADSDLPTLAAGHYGVHSWAQSQFSTGDGSAYRERGTEVQALTVASDAFNKTHTFADAIVADWRDVRMTDGLGGQGTEGRDYGNFRQDFRKGTIVDDSNSYDWATSAAPNIDFLGAAVAIATAGSEAWTDYDMTVRVMCADDEGPGVLVRVQGDKTFYRVNFAKQAMDTAGQRAPRGMSIQKCLDGVWTELFRDNQDNPLFIYTDDTDGDAKPFDLRVRVIGDTIAVRVINDPDGAANVIEYDPVVDVANPILSGSVGLTNWGAGAVGQGVVFSPYGGEAGHALLTVVPEPSSLVLLGLLALLPLALRRWR